MAIQIKDRAIVHVIGGAQDRAEGVRRKVKMRAEIQGHPITAPQRKFRPNWIWIREWRRKVVPEQAGSGRPGGIVVVDLLELSREVCAGEVVFPDVRDWDEREVLLSQSGRKKRAG